jgi:hypothetical protein
MRARQLMILPLILTTLLASCDGPGQAIGAIESVLSEKTPEARKAAVVRQVKAVCPVPLSADEAEWAAQFVEENRSKGAVYVAGLLWKMNAASRLCRGLK